MTEIKNIGESVELATIPMDRYKKLLEIEKSIASGPGFKRTILYSYSWPGGHLEKMTEWAMTSDGELYAAIWTELHNEKMARSDMSIRHQRSFDEIKKDRDRLEWLLIEERKKKRFWFW